MRFYDFPSHFRLMLLASRVSLSHADMEQIRRTLDEQVNWQQFIKVVLTHRVAPIVLQSLNAAAPSRIPVEVTESLDIARRENSMRAIQNILETKCIARTLQQQGFDVTILKGPMLSELSYGDPLRRHSIDLDLLTASVELDRQIVCMETLGYKLLMPSCKLSPRRLRSYSHYRKDFTFQHQRSGVVVDLHWRLLNNVEHMANRLAESTVSTQGKLFGEQLLTLSRLDQFLYCAAHGVLDAWIYLRGLVDFSAFLKILTPAELAEAVARAEEIGLLAQVSSAIHWHKPGWVSQS
jgi:hypothetical protein